MIIMLISLAYLLTRVVSGRQGIDHYALYIPILRHYLRYVLALGA